MKNLNNIEVKDPEVVSEEFSEVIKQLDIEEAKKTLKEAGYFVDNLWHVSDVTMNYECTDEEAKEVLLGAFKNEATYEQIWTSIKYEAEYMEIKHK